MWLSRRSRQVNLSVDVSARISHRSIFAAWSQTCQLPSRPMLTKSHLSGPSSSRCRETLASTRMSSRSCSLLQRATPYTRQYVRNLAFLARSSRSRSDCPAPGHSMSLGKRQSSTSQLPSLLPTTSGSETRAIPIIALGGGGIRSDYMNPEDPALVLEKKESG